MKRRLPLAACSLAVAGFVSSSSGQIQVAGTLQVNVDATGSPVGALTYLTNSGAMGGVFIARNNNVASVTPQVVALGGGSGTHGFLLDGNSISLQHYTDNSGTDILLPPAGMVGVAPVFSVECWMYKHSIMNETAPVAWGNRQNGMNVSCNWGRHLTWGGFSWQGGSWDHGWNSYPTAGEWHHLVWTYDGVGNLKLYRDTVLDKEVFQSTAVNVESTNNIVLGVQHANAGWNGFANGVLAKVRIHDGVLTPAQIANNYNLEVGSLTIGRGAQDLVSPPIHRYSFNQPAADDAVGLTVPDTGTSPAGAATIRGNAGTASFDGYQLSLNGGSSASAAYVDLPNGILSSLSSSNGGSGQVTFEMWVSPTAQNWGRLFDFGDTTIGEVTAPGGSFSGNTYILFTGQVGGDQEHCRVEVRSAGNGSAGTVGSRLIGGESHVVATWDEASNQIKIYINGVLAGGYTVAHKINAITDVNNWLGRSNWSGDNNMGGGYREFRMYDRVLSEAEVRRNYLTGPADNVSSTTLVWNGNTSGNWDTTTANWLADAASVNFTNGAGARLDDSATGTTTINLSDTLTPASITVANGSKPYAIGGTGKLSGSTGLMKDGAGTLTFSGSQINDYTGPTLLLGGKTVVSALANGGSPSALGAASSNPTNLILGGILSYQGPATTIDRGISLANLESTIEVLNSLTLSSGIQGGTMGTFVKRGPGTLVLANTSSNLLSNGNGPAFSPGFNVAQGTVVLDGNPSGGTQTNRVRGELWVGGTLDFPGHMVLSNSTLIADTWVGIGRGNGSIGNVSTMRFENSRMIISANGLAMGYQPGYNTNFASPSLTLNGSSTIYVPGNVNVGESSGSSATVTLNGSSWLRGSTIRLGISAGSTGAVTIANSSLITNANYTSIGTAAANATYAGGAGTMVIKDNAGFYSASDFNVSDVGSATGGSVGQLDLMNNAALTTGNLFVGKGQGTIGVLNQSGGAITVFGNAATVGSGAGSQGTLNISAGTFAYTNSTANLIVGGAGTGTLTVSGGANVNVPNNLIIGNASGAVGTLNLDGGTITAKRVYMADPGAGSTLTFNGGTLMAAPGAASDFLSGLSAAYIGAGGAKIDTGGNNLTSSQDIFDIGGGSFTKLGAGTISFSGTLYYSGPTIVSGGKLAITTRQYSTADITVADGAELSVQVADFLGASISPANVTAGGPSGSAITVDLGNFGNPPTAPINVSAGILTANGTVTVNVQGTVSATGEIPLISYGSLAGSGSFVLGSLPPGVFGYLTNDTAATPKFIGIVVTSVKMPRWEGLAGGFWDIEVTQNWIDQGTSSPDYFYQGSRALFNDEALGTTTVDLVANVAPGGVVVNNNTLNYVIGGTGRIGGSAGITKLGTGSLTLSTTNNNYTGPTVVDGGGTLATTVANNLGAGSALVISNAGILSLAGNSQQFGSVTLADGTIAATGATVTAPAINLETGTVGAVLAGGTLTTFGTNTGSVSVQGNNTYTGPTILGGSTLVVPTIANGGSPSGVGASSSNPTNLVFNGGTLSYTGPAATTDRGYSVQDGGTFSVSGNLALLGEVDPRAGGFNKAGPGTLTYARPGTNFLTTGGYFIGQGTVLFDGGASTPGNYLQTNRINGSVYVGYDEVNAGFMVVSNSSLNVSSWVAIDRGNGTVGSSSRLTLYDSIVTSGNMSMGYDNGISGNSSFPVITLLGNSSYTSANRSYIGESVGANATAIIAGNSRFVQNAEWFALGNAGKGTMVLSNNAFVSMPGDYNLGDIANGDGTLNVYDNATNLAATLYVGKGNDSGPAVGLVNQYGGFVGRSSGGGDWRIGGNSSTTTAGSVGTYNLYGGILQPSGNFQIGAWGTGTLNQSGGIANCSSYPVVGRFPGSIGTLFVSGGQFNQTGTGQLLIIGEEGTGTLTITNAGVVTSANGISVGHTATGVGTINLDGGALVTTRIWQNGAAGAQSTVNLNGGVLVANGNNANFMFGLGTANVTARGAIIDTTNYNITIAQPLVADLASPGGGLTKRGAGVLTLAGTNTYTGMTTVNEGALAVNGSIPGSATVKSGAALGGNGTVAGTLAVEAGGAVSAGTSIGSLTLGATPVLNGFVFAEVNRNGGAPLADLITVSGGPITYGGTLAITNTGADLVVGDTFKLFQATGYSGSFTLLSLTPRQVVTWNTASLTANGTISVQSVQTSLPNTPTNIVGIVVGNNLEISWPTEYTGWILQGQTNAITVGLANNWATVPGSETTNRVIIPINSANGSSFYRLVHP